LRVKAEGAEVAEDAEVEAEDGVRSDSLA
jgi:hypothetical protein